MVTIASGIDALIIRSISCASIGMGVAPSRAHEPREPRFVGGFQLRHRYRTRPREFQFRAAGCPDDRRGEAARPRLLRDVAKQRSIAGWNGDNVTALVLAEPDGNRIRACRQVGGCAN